MSTKVDARILRSRGKLQSALLELVGERPLSEITVADITARADVGYATFFRHYTDKTELWHEVADSVTTELLAHIAPMVDQGSTEQLAQRFCAYIDANRVTLRAIVAQGAEGAVREDLVRRASALAEQGTRRRIVGIPRELAILHATNATLGLLVWWLEHRDQVSVPQMAKILDRLVLTPLRTPSTPDA